MLLRCTGRTLISWRAAISTCVAGRAACEAGSLSPTDAVPREPARLTHASCRPNPGERRRRKRSSRPRVPRRAATVSVLKELLEQQPQLQRIAAGFSHSRAEKGVYLFRPSPRVPPRDSTLSWGKHSSASSYNQGGHCNSARLRALVRAPADRERKQAGAASSRWLRAGFSNHLAACHASESIAGAFPLRTHGSKLTHEHSRAQKAADAARPPLTRRRCTPLSRFPGDSPASLAGTSSPLSTRRRRKAAAARRRTRRSPPRRAAAATSAPFACRGIHLAVSAASDPAACEISHPTPEQASGSGCKSKKKEAEKVPEIDENLWKQTQMSVTNWADCDDDDDFDTLAPPPADWVRGGARRGQFAPHLGHCATRSAGAELALPTSWCSATPSQTTRASDGAARQAPARAMR